MFTNLDWASVVEQQEEQFEAKRYVDLPAGNYDVIIDKVVFEPAKESKNGNQIPPFLAYNLTVVSDGEFKGCGTVKRDGFWNASSASFIKRDILRLGCDVPQNMEDIPFSLQSVIGNTIIAVFVSVKPRNDGGEFRSIYINSVKGKIDKVVPAKSTVKKIEPMDESNAKRLNAAAGNLSNPINDPFGGVFDGDVEPPF